MGGIEIFENERSPEVEGTSEIADDEAEIEHIAQVNTKVKGNEKGETTDDKGSYGEGGNTQTADSEAEISSGGDTSAVDTRYRDGVKKREDSGAEWRYSQGGSGAIQAANRGAEISHERDQEQVDTSGVTLNEKGGDVDEGGSCQERVDAGINMTINEGHEQKPDYEAEPSPVVEILADGVKCMDEVENSGNLEQEGSHKVEGTKEVEGNKSPICYSGDKAEADTHVEEDKKAQNVDVKGDWRETGNTASEADISSRGGVDSHEEFIIRGLYRKQIVNRKAEITSGMGISADDLKRQDAIEKRENAEGEDEDSY